MFVPFEVKAWLSQGVVLDYNFGLTLDGLLASTMRKKYSHGLPGSIYDGGLNVTEPIEVDLPLGKCFLGNKAIDNLGKPVWHWQASAGIPMNYSNERISLSPPDQHRLLGKIDEKRMFDTTVALPKEVGGSRGRFRIKTTPILNVPAAYIMWRGIGNIEEIKENLIYLDAIGARRGSGEGAVFSWEFTEVKDLKDVEVFVHTNYDGSLSRPVPLACAEHTRASQWRIAVGGIRPPLFHPARQLNLAVPAVV